MEEIKTNNVTNNPSKTDNVKKTDSIINKKMNSDKKITKYQNEIIKERVNLSTLGFNEQIPLDNSLGSIGTTLSAT